MTGENMDSLEADQNFKWYVVHTYSGFEEKAKSALIDRIKQKGMESRFGDIIVPKKTIEKIGIGGKKKKVERTSYPGYILVQMVLDDETRHVVKETPKITDFVGNSKKPRPITDAEALRLTSPEAVAESARVVPEVSFEKGETVKVTDGPFTSFDGIVDEVRPDKMKLRILVSIFGRETPVELDFSQVHKSGN